jgi:hypothetical protein
VAEAMSDAALVIGIDEYDNASIPKLSGCVADAYGAVAWLLGQGIEPKNVFLHVAKADAKAGIDPAVKVNPADFKAVAKSVNELSRRVGERLFVVLSGHGLHVREDGPIFLLQDYAEPSAKSNLAIREYLDYFRSWSFKDQFVFYDACQNPTSVIGQTSAVQAQGPDPDRGTYDPLPGNALTACYSASPGQRALEVEGRGLLIRRLLVELDLPRLETLSPADPRQNCVRYDWYTGARQLDLKEIFDSQVRPAIVSKAAAQEYSQTPHCERHGRANIENASPVLELSKQPTIKVSISTKPLEARKEIERVLLAIPTPSRWLHLPDAMGPLVIPMECLAPPGSQLEATCELRTPSEWRVLNSPQREDISAQPEKLFLDFDLAHTGPPPPDDPRSQLNVRVVPSGGGPPVPTISGEYDRIAENNNLQTEMPAGVTFDHNEIGPDIGFDPSKPGSRDAANQVAIHWAKAIRKQVAGQGFDVFISRVGEPDKLLLPNLRFEFEKEGARALAGFLADRQTVSLVGMGGSEPPFRYSLNELANHPDERVAPGPYRVSVSLPWGDWQQDFSAFDGRKVTVSLPSSVGLPPLRNEWLSDSTNLSGLFYLSTDDDSRLVIIGDDTARTAIQLPGCDAIAKISGGRLRIEPFSLTSLPEWDLIFTSGRADSLSEEDVERLVQESESLPTREGYLLRLAIAYAASSRNMVPVVKRLLSRLSRPGKFARADELLLDFWLLRQEGHFPKAGPFAGMLPIMGMPILRWGDALLQYLCREIEETPAWWSRKLDDSSVLAVLRSEFIDELIERDPKLEFTNIRPFFSISKRAIRAHRDIIEAIDMRPAVFSDAAAGSDLKVKEVKRRKKAKDGSNEGTPGAEA